MFVSLLFASNAQAQQLKETADPYFHPAGTVERQSKPQSQLPYSASKSSGAFVPESSRFLPQPGSSSPKQDQTPNTSDFLPGRTSSNASDLELSPAFVSTPAPTKSGGLPPLRPSLTQRQHKLPANSRVRDRERPKRPLLRPPTKGRIFSNKPSIGESW